MILKIVIIFIKIKVILNVNKHMFLLITNSITKHFLIIIIYIYL
jgi:hypothetical protein